MFLGGARAYMFLGGARASIFYVEPEPPFFWWIRGGAALKVRLPIPIITEIFGIKHVGKNHVHNVK